VQREVVRRRAGVRVTFETLATGNPGGRAAVEAIGREHRASTHRGRERHGRRTEAVVDALALTTIDVLPDPNVTPMRDFTSEIRRTSRRGESLR